MNNKKLEQVLERIEKNVKLKTLWDASNTMTVRRLGMTDHGKTHVIIVSNIALKLLRNLKRAGIMPDSVKDYNLEYEDSEIIVFLASILHDIGNSITRDDHERMSVILASPLIDGILEGLYTEREKTIIASEILHAILCHDTNCKIHTTEGGIIMIADGLDMEKGRARIPFDLGKVDIHSVSALSIENVNISYSKETPIMIDIQMSNSAGIFQVDYLLKNKIDSSGISKYVSVTAHVREGKEKKIIEQYKLASEEKKGEDK